MRHNKRAMDAHSPDVYFQLPIVPVPGQSAGLMVPKGIGRHPRRVIPVYDLLFVREGILYIQEEEQEFEVRVGEALLLWPHRLHWGRKTSQKIYATLGWSLPSRKPPGEKLRRLLSRYVFNSTHA